MVLNEKKMDENHEGMFVITAEKREVAKADDVEIPVMKFAAETRSIVERYQFELQRCAMCPIVATCAHTRDTVAQCVAEAKEAGKLAYQEFIASNGGPDSIVKGADLRQQTEKQVLLDTANERLKDERCIFEKKATLDVVQRFAGNGYNIADPRVNIILGELLDNIVQTGRINKVFTDTGLLLTRRTPQGDVMYANPLLEYKTKFSRLVIEALKTIDDMIKSDVKTAQDQDFTTYLLDKLRLENQKGVIDIETKKTEERIQEMRR